jgi:hypothetical protein
VYIIITDLSASAHIFTKWKVLFYRTGELEDGKEEDF